MTNDQIFLRKVAIYCTEGSGLLKAERLISKRPRQILSIDEIIEEDKQKKELTFEELMKQQGD